MSVRATVECGGCHKAMDLVRVVATVTHEYQDGQATVTPMLLFRCATPDCGTELIIEGA